jgi:hypothetical protein
VTIALFEWANARRRAKIKSVIALFISFIELWTDGEAFDLGFFDMILFKWI